MVTKRYHIKYRRYVKNPRYRSGKRYSRGAQSHTYKETISDAINDMDAIEKGRSFLEIIPESDTFSRPELLGLIKETIEFIPI